MVPEVEELRTEVQPHVFPRKLELLDDGEIGVDEVRPGNWGAGSVAQLTRCRLRKAGRVEPFVEGVGGRHWDCNRRRGWDA